MEFKDIISVTGQPGLWKMLKQRPDGLILSRIDGTERKFMSSRIHMFTPLENISIYTLNDSVPLKDVYKAIQDKYPDGIGVSVKSEAAELRSFMEGILPEYDPEKVQISDIKKLIKWYAELCHHNIVFDREDAGEAE